MFIIYSDGKPQQPVDELWSEYKMNIVYRDGEQNKQWTVVSF